jgi:hypothetical protein
MWPSVIVFASLLLASTLAYVLFGWRRSPLAQKAMYVVGASAFAAGLFVGIWTFHLFSGTRFEPEHSASSPPSAEPSAEGGGTTGRSGSPLAGCSTKELSRVCAATWIQSQASFKATLDKKVVVGRFFYDYRNVDSDFPFKALSAAGILTPLKETPESSATTGFRWWREYMVDLTEAGQQEANSWVRTSEKVQQPLGGPPSPQGTVYLIPLANKKLLEVTGIALGLDGRQAQIEFTWKWVGSAQAKLLPDSVPPEAQRGNCFAQLYDDGWRIGDLNF